MTTEPPDVEVSGRPRSATSSLIGVMSLLMSETWPPTCETLTADAREQRWISGNASWTHGKPSLAWRTTPRRQRSGSRLLSPADKRSTTARGRRPSGVRPLLLVMRRCRRRLEATPTTRLASAFAAIAEHLYTADSYDAVLLRIAADRGVHRRRV